MVEIPRTLLVVVAAAVKVQMACQVVLVLVVTGEAVSHHP
jgi:hypothetical protein